MVKNLVTTTLVILCISISIYSWFSDTEFIFNNYGYSTENLLVGNFWVLITSIFLHASLEHLISNIVVLLLFGLTLEEEIGSRRFLLLFFGGAFLGNFLSSLIYPANQVSIGASAGIFSIVGATMLIKPIRMEIFLPIPLGIIGIGYLIYAIIGAVTGYPPHVAHIAHIGGSLVGLTYGFYKKGFRNALKIMIALFLLLLFVPII
jgi:membrane associated rhomboid family serine protease